MRSVWVLAWAVSLAGLGGCNALLDLKSGPVPLDGGGAGDGGCKGEDCDAACERNADCPGDSVCREGACQALELDGGPTTSQDGGDAGCADGCVGDASADADDECSEGTCVDVCTPGDTDCGGDEGDIPRTCDTSGRWQTETPCESPCQAGMCVPTTCEDGTKNGNESDTDCGGSCAPCESGSTCESDEDCALPGSGKCLAGQCAAASCEDGVQNQDESDVDCGGSCSDCTLDSRCGSNDDCASQACISGTCAACRPDATRCVDMRTVETCNESGQWDADDDVVCMSPTPYCDGGSCTAEPPSCRDLAANCGAANESCCTTVSLPQGIVPRGRSADGADAWPTGNDNELPEKEVAIGSYKLDKYEVTVGRFRQFVAAYDNWREAGSPSNEEGAHTSGTGWQSAWGQHLPASSSEFAESLACTLGTWTPTPGDNEANPVNCVGWYEAFAFCLWDGGRLPTEAEWEYAAAGGSENRLYPWGSEEPTCDRATMGGCPGDAQPVGTAEAGASRWGHLDLAGNVAEWTFDYRHDEWYETSASCCIDPVNLVPSQYSESASAYYRTTRGSTYSNTAGGPNRHRVVYRGNGVPSLHSSTIGIRCARDL